MFLRWFGQIKIDQSRNLDWSDSVTIRTLAEIVAAAVWLGNKSRAEGDTSALDQFFRVANQLWAVCLWGHRASKGLVFPLLLRRNNWPSENAVLSNQIPDTHAYLMIGIEIFVPTITEVRKAGKRFRTNANSPPLSSINLPKHLLF